MKTEIVIQKGEILRQPAPVMIGTRILQGFEVKYKKNIIMLYVPIENLVEEEEKKEAKE